MKRSFQPYRGVYRVGIWMVKKGGKNMWLCVVEEGGGEGIQGGVERGRGEWWD